MPSQRSCRARSGAPGGRSRSRRPSASRLSRAAARSVPSSQPSSSGCAGQRGARQPLAKVRDSARRRSRPRGARVRSPRRLPALQQVAQQVHCDDDRALADVGAVARQHDVARQQLPLGALDAEADVADRLLLGAAVGPRDPRSPSRRRRPRSAPGRRRPSPRRPRARRRRGARSARRRRPAARSWPRPSTRPRPPLKYADAPGRSVRRPASSPAGAGLRHGHRAPVEALGDHLARSSPPPRCRSSARGAARSRRAAPRRPPRRPCGGGRR